MKTNRATRHRTTSARTRTRRKATSAAPRRKATRERMRTVARGAAKETTQKDSIESAIRSAKQAGLTYSTDEKPGFRRIRSGGGFRYVDSAGKPLRGREHLRRIQSLVIPPAWTDVWICPVASGHLQATGRDVRGRKQHRYHPEWREARDATKYDHLIEFARMVPKIRRRVARDIAKAGFGRERVLATVVRLMDLTAIRVGNEEYARDNKSYGLTTLKNQHAKVRGGTIRFRFRGKSGKHHDIDLTDRRLAKIVRGCQDIPGQDLFAYYDDDGNACDVTSRDVNEYLAEASGSADTSARDFRTWSGTVLAMQQLQNRRCSGAGEIKRNLVEGIREVASKLGNTPTVCRRCYIHPFVIERYECGKLPRGKRIANGRTTRSTSLGPIEKATLSFLQSCRREARTRRSKAKARGVPKSWRA